MKIGKGQFFKKYDRYAKQVSLTYLKSGTYRTAAGGACSIFSFTILVYWLAVNIFYAIYDYGTYSTSTQTVLLQGANGEYPEFELS